MKKQEIKSIKTLNILFNRVTPAIKNIYIIYYHSKVTEKRLALRERNYTPRRVCKNYQEVCVKQILKNSGSQLDFGLFWPSGCNPTTCALEVFVERNGCAILCFSPHNLYTCIFIFFLFSIWSYSSNIKKKRDCRQLAVQYSHALPDALTRLSG